MVTDNTHLTLYSVLPMQSPEQAQLPFPSRSPQHFEWLHCWDPHLGGSLGHSEGTQGPASRRNHPPPWLAQMFPWLSWHQCLLILPGQTLDICMAQTIFSSSVILLRSGSPVWPNSCWLMVIFSRASSESSVPVVAIPASAAEAAAACRASSSCRLRPAQDQHWDLLQIQSHWHQDPSWHHLHRPKSEN
uniref:Uncharacterized protein n=1 Tax=Pan troglodytes TaxID=9598 RepID=A0A2I3TEJ6_PANTR